MPRTICRFVPPSNVYGTPQENPRNQCFCKEGECAPSGLFNISTCQVNLLNSVKGWKGG